MCTNFDFLKVHSQYDSFSGACIEAEKSLVVSYATTAILSRRALELAVKWVFSFDAELKAPYQDNLSALIHDYTFRSIVDVDLLPKLNYIKNLGNKTVHSSSVISREQAVLSLRNLFEFISWIDYCYSDAMNEAPFDESLLHDNEKERKTRKELQDLYDQLGSKDRKLDEVIKENAELRQATRAKRVENEQQRDFNVDSICEFKTRKLYIDLELQMSGWTFGRDCREEVEVKGMPNNQGIGFVDYVLYGEDGKPLAVVEAKRTSKDPRVGKQQAKLYADCLEQEYGRRPLIFYTNGFEYYLWDDTSYPERIVSGIYTKDELEWAIYKRLNKKSLKTASIRDDITNRPYQKMAIQAVCDTLDTGHRKALLVMATGSGKTRTVISLVDVLLKKSWVKNVLFLADRTALVRQAKKNFQQMLPELSLCNLLNGQDNPESRMVFSTYPTMMNAIDDTKRQDGSRLFTSGHFDLIIIDESHRSIYKKYQAIFDYFDGILVGLTATPKSDLDKNTYRIFDLENNVPTFAYELSEAVQEGYLVQHYTIETKMKFMEDGIHYDELSEDEQEQFEETFEDDVTDISSSALNEFLFNTNTVDTVLQNLMMKGIRVSGGDKLGKTIVFANNKKHADFVVERFDAIYPEHRGGHTRVVYNGLPYVDTIIEKDFPGTDSYPQIAVSVDMLDTGIDIPNIVNLVFFKKVRSKSKFWQMIGRGTRLCPDLFGVGLHKTQFCIFDYCSNFEFFRENKMSKEAKLTKSLTENIFNTKVEIIRELQRMEYQKESLMAHRQVLVGELWRIVSQIDETRFNARMKLRYLHTFNRKEAWNSLSDEAVRELSEHVAPLIPAIEDDELAKRFDYLMLTIELAELQEKQAFKPKMRVMETADRLSAKGSIEAVRRQADLIKEVQTSEFWEEADIFDLERVRIVLRELLRFLDTMNTQIYYTDFKDEVLCSETKDGEYMGSDLQNYRKKVNQYLKAHEDDMAVYKLRHNKPMTTEDIRHLEDILWNQLGTKEEYVREFGDEPLLKLVSRIIGLSPAAANEAFSEFLSDETLNSEQMEFVKLVVTYIIEKGVLDKAELNDPPFNKNGSIVNLFEGKIDVVKRIISRIDAINARVDVG